MKEKVSEHAIDRPLTAEGREKIDRFIQSKGSRLGRAFSHEWDETGCVLVLTSAPVKWQFVFHPERVEVFGSAPPVLKMLFTEGMRGKVEGVIREMLEEAGLRGKG